MGERALLCRNIGSVLGSVNLFNNTVTIRFSAMQILNPSVLIPSARATVWAKLIAELERRSLGRLGHVLASGPSVRRDKPACSRE